MTITRIVSASFFVCASLLAQGSNRPSVQQTDKPVIAAPQPAQSVTVNLSPDVATALESLRLSTSGPRNANGVSAPQFATIQEMWETLTRPILARVLQQYPPASVKAAQDAAAKANADAQQAAAAAIQAPKQVPPR